MVAGPAIIPAVVSWLQAVRDSRSDLTLASDVSVERRVPVRKIWGAQGKGLKWPVKRQVPM